MVMTRLLRVQRWLVTGLAAVLWTRGAPLAVTSYEDGEEVRYPVVLLRGTTDPAVERVTVTNRASNRASREMAGLAREGCFAVLAELVPGENVLSLSAGDAATELRLRYRPHANPARVRVIYVTDASGDTAFDRPEGVSDDWRGRLRTAALLMQTFTAEQCRLAGLPRRTFGLELDSDGEVVIHLLRAGRTAAEYQAMDGQALYREMARERDAALPPGENVDLVIPAFTRFDRTAGRPVAHTALGGGNLALFGSGNLFTWPASLAEVQPAFMDARRVDPALFFSDSVGRHTYWACASTTMGAALHELGHVFGLPHSTAVHDIMTRGHDRFNRYFTLVEPPHAGCAAPYSFRTDEVAAWMPVSLLPLVHERLLFPDPPPPLSPEPPRVGLDLDRLALTIESEAGVGAVVVQTYGTPEGTVARAALEVPAAEPLQRRVTVPAARIGRLTGSLQTSLAIRDGTGRRHQVRLPDLLAGPFVERWHMAPETVPWPDAGRFPDVSPERLQALTQAAFERPARQAPGPFVDLLTWLAPGTTTQTAAYLCRRIRVTEATPVRIATGSDDALRLWLDGALIREVLALRSAAPDAEWTDAVFQPGTHVLAVEVSQGLGDWGLYLRFVTPQGVPLRLTDDDVLVTEDPARAARLRLAIEGQFVRRWHLWPEVLPWTEHGAFVPMTEELRRRIENECAATPPVSAPGPGPIVDLAAALPEGRRSNVAGYALCRMVSPGPRRVRLHSGSDDSLRMWLNGKEIRSVLALRGTVPDSECTEAELQPGENRLLMEISQAAGDWGFCLRLEDGEGRPLALDVGGELVPLEPAAVER